MIVRYTHSGRLYTTGCGSVGVARSTNQLKVLPPEPGPVTPMSGEAKSPYRTPEKTRLVTANSVSAASTHCSMLNCQRLTS